MKTRFSLLLIAVGVVVAGFAARWPAMRFADFELSDLGSRFATLFLFALLIERTVEVLLAVSRAEESLKRQAEVQRLRGAGRSGLDPEVRRAQDSVIEYRAETMRRAVPLSFFLGLLIASLGVRVVAQFIERDPSQMSDAQSWWFDFADIVLTASLLAGGADPIHKVMDAFRKFMEASSARSSGTK